MLLEKGQAPTLSEAVGEVGSPGSRLLADAAAPEMTGNAKKAIATTRRIGGDWPEPAR
jgi:hypothetical protein